MGNIQGEDKVSVWEYVNPVNLVKESISSYTSPMSAAIYGPWRAMSMGYGATLPGLMPMHLPAIMGGRGPGQAFQHFAIQSWHRMASPAFRSNPVGKFVGSAGKSLLFGVGSDQADNVALQVANKGIFGARRYYMRAAKDGMLAAEKIAAERGAMFVGEKGLAAAGMKVGSRAIGGAALIHLGRVVNPVMNILAVAQVAAWATEAAYKGIRTTVDILDRTQQRVSNLELGGELTRGFLTSQAATERQRALQAIQASHLSGRRFMGNEASMLHQ